MKRWIILCLAFSSGLLSANAGSTVVKDSLLRIYVSAPHDSTRLDVLHDIARLDQQTPVFLYYENKLLQEATAQNNLRYHLLLQQTGLGARHAMDGQNGKSGREA